MLHPTRSSADLLAFRSWGRGPRRTMVLHDWTSSSRSYRRLMPRLDREASTFVFPDLRGYGASADLEGCYSFEEISADCARLADHLGWDRFAVVGHSMTGAAAQRIAVDLGPRISGLVAICPMSASGSPAGPEAKAFFRQTTTDDDAFRRLIGFVAPALPKACVERKLRHNRRATRTEARQAYLEMFWNASFADEVRGLEVETLVLVGDGDPGLDAAAMALTFMDWHPNATLQVLERCGHFPMLEQPQTLARHIDAFMAGTT